MALHAMGKKENLALTCTFGERLSPLQPVSEVALTSLRAYSVLGFLTGLGFGDFP